MCHGGVILRKLISDLILNAIGANHTGRRLQWLNIFLRLPD